MIDTYSSAKSIYFYRSLSAELYEIFDKLRITEDEIDGINEAIADYLITYLAHTSFYKKFIDKSTSETQVEEIRTESINYLDTIDLRFHKSLISLGIDESKARTFQEKVFYHLETINGFTEKEDKQLLFLILESRLQKK